jgi:hypothetical protein
MSKHTLEQVLEALINKEDDRASDLLHQYFVQKGKSIYEELSQFDEAAEEELDEEVEEELEEGFGDSASHDFEDEVIANEEDLEDESLFGEAEGDEDPMAADEPTDDEATADLAMGDEAEGGEGAPADAAGAAEKLDVATDALEELKAFFAELTGDAPAMGGDEPAMDDAPAMGGDEPTEEGYRAFGEATTLKAVSKPTPGDNGANTKSPVGNGPKVGGNGAKAVNFTGDSNKAGTQGGVLNPSTKEDNAGNVNKVGNAKAPAPKGVSVPKNSDAASNKTSPVAKS